MNKELYALALEDAANMLRRNGVAPVTPLGGYTVLLPDGDKSVAYPSKSDEEEEAVTRIFRDPYYRKLRNGG